MALTKIDDRGLKTPIDLLDNEKIRFGTGNDLELYHDGSSVGYIKNTTGLLKILSDGQVSITDAGNNEDLAKFIDNGACELYYDNAKKFETRSGGVTVTGQITASGSYSAGDSIKYMAGDGDDLQIYHSGTNTFFENTTGNVYFRNDGSATYFQMGSGNETGISIAKDDGVFLYFNDVQKFQTTSYGVLISSRLNAQTISIEDWNSTHETGAIKLGTGNDLKIYHDGSNSWITNSTGVLVAGTADFQVASVAGDEQMIRAYDDGAVELYYDNSKKLETTTNGPAVSSQGADDSKLYFLTSGHTTTRIGYVGLNQFGMDVNGGVQIRDAGNSYETMFKTVSNGAVELYHNGTKKFETSSSGASVLGSLYCSDNLNLTNDNKKINLGDSSDLQIYHDGSHSYIKDTGTGNLKIDGSDNVELQSGGSTKAYTYANGLFVYNQQIPDNGVLNIGNGSDLQLYHNGSESWFKNNTSTMNFLTAGAGQWVQFKNNADNETLFRAQEDGPFQAYYDGSIKAQTHSTGFLVDTCYLRACSDGNFTDLSTNSHGLRVTNDNWGLRVVNSHATLNYGIEAFFNNSHPDDSTSRFFAGRDDQTNRFVVYSDGDVANHDGTYGQTSDIKLKENIVDANSQWDDIKAVRVRNFNFKIDDPSKKQIGVVAQELETVCPGLVKDNPDLDENNKDLGTTTKSVKSSILYMKAIKALQEAITRIETLETEVAALKAK